jgi:hypothetical protein
VTSAWQYNETPVTLALRENYYNAAVAELLCARQRVHIVPLVAVSPLVFAVSAALTADVRAGRFARERPSRAGGVVLEP